MSAGFRAYGMKTHVSRTLAGSTPDRVIGGAVHLVSAFTTSEPHAHAQGETMTYNRMDATPIAGEHCRFCGDAKAPLVKTPCCDQ